MVEQEIKDYVLPKLAKRIDNYIHLVDCYADWCGPCKAIAPYFQELKEQNKNIIFLKCNIDEHHEFAKKHLGGVNSPEHKKYKAQIDKQDLKMHGDTGVTTHHQD